MTRSRLMTAAFLLGRKRAERRAQAERDALAREFEEINCATATEVQGLRHDIARMNPLANAPEVGGDGRRRLH